MGQRYTFAGNADFFATGAAMAEDGPDGDATNVDTFVHPAITNVSANDVPQDANLRKAFLYWGGSITNDDCAGGTIDDTVTFTPPGEATGDVTADACYCSDAAAGSYDIQLCRADVTNLLGDIHGDYAVDDFAALISNGSTNNASFSIVLVYTESNLPARRIAVYDGLLTMWNQSNPSEVVVLDQIEIDDPPAGDLTWYALEGDVGGGGAEGVSVLGQPGGQGMDLADELNPIGNPMNHTINTTAPPQSDALGVDIDEFDISDALTAGDTSVETTYLGGNDKYWIAYNVVGVNIFAPSFGEASDKTWTLEDDADDSGDPTPGDTIRYAIHLENTGDAVGTLSIDDPIPSQAASWTLIDAGGGTDVSTPDNLILEDITLEAGASTTVLFDVVIADGTEGEDMLNTALYDAPPDGGAGQLAAPPVPIAGGGGEDDTTDSGDTGESSDTGESTEDGSGTDDGSTGGDTAGESGEDGSQTSTDGGPSETTAADDFGGFDDGGGDSGCNCATDPRPGSAPLFGLSLLALLGLGVRRRR